MRGDQSQTSTKTNTMKVILLKQDESAVGWSMIPETHEDQLILGSIRNLCFWAEPEYAGMTSMVTNQKMVTSLSWLDKPVNQSDARDAILKQVPPFNPKQ